MINDCPHCDPASFALKYPLEITNNFYAVCDVHPLIRGHILIIPKVHISCVGEYPGDILMELQLLYDKAFLFIKKTFGSVASFEHGAIGQTVFHSHVHILPFSGKASDIITEGESRIKPLHSLFDLKEVFEKDKGYLFFSIDEKMYVADKILGAPRFFRDRFAKALGVPERGNWKTMQSDAALMLKADQEIKDLLTAWKNSV